MLFVCVANYILALILFALSMLSDRSVSRKLKVAAMFFAIEIGFSLMVFSFCNILISIFLESAAGHLLEFKYGLNKFIVVLGAFIVIGQMVVYTTKIHDVNDSQLYYRRSKNYTHFFPFVFIGRTMLVVLGIVLYAYLGKVSSYIVLGSEAAYIIGIYVARPYKRIIDYVRFGIIEIVLLMLFLSRFM